jgi:hypothetical protein
MNDQETQTARPDEDIPEGSVCTACGQAVYDPSLGLTDEQWQWAVKQEAERLRVARQTCKHSGYRGFSVDGRCCRDCGTSMVDFGD